MPSAYMIMSAASGFMPATPILSNGAPSAACRFPASSTNAPTASMASSISGTKMSGSQLSAEASARAGAICARSVSRLAAMVRPRHRSLHPCAGQLNPCHQPGQPAVAVRLLATCMSAIRKSRNLSKCAVRPAATQPQGAKPASRHRDPDAFMRAVENDEDGRWSVRRVAQSFSRISARALWIRISPRASKPASRICWFIDNVNRAIPNITKLAGLDVRCRTSAQRDHAADGQDKDGKHPHSRVLPFLAQSRKIPRMGRSPTFIEDCLRSLTMCWKISSSARPTAWAAPSTQPRASARLVSA